MDPAVEVALPLMLADRGFATNLAMVGNLFFASSSAYGQRLLRAAVILVDVRIDDAESHVPHICIPSRNVGGV
jgi:hypothetical protein